MADILEQAMKVINSTATEEKNTTNALTLGLGFHKFDGNISVNEVINQIGANFEVREDKIVRLPQDQIEAILRGEQISIDPNCIIDTHKATVCVEKNKTIGVVGESYGTIQNTTCFDLIDMMCNSSVNQDPLKIVSAGLVHDFEPYIQAELPTRGRIDGDKSETKFYIFAHTSHDGTSGLQIRFSPVRVICQNTFMQNVTSKLGLTFKHSRYAPQRFDFTKQTNITAIQEKLRKLVLFSEDYINQMNAFKLAKVNDTDIENYVLNLFVDKEDLKRQIKLHNYNLDLVDDLSTRTKNIITDFKNTLYSDDLGQDFAQGTKLWLFNGTTNYLSNTASYGNAKKDDTLTLATKRFDSMLNGSANKKMEKAMELLVA
jgi:hypothetical protein